MNIDLRGRIKNTRLPASRPLWPLFEAIVNSLQSVESVAQSKGKIEIDVKRETAQASVDLGDGAHEPITGFVVMDNGRGFDEENYRSFKTSDSTLKAAVGGKGIGRLLWLKAFEEVVVDSTFHETDGATYRRRFKFTLSEQGVEDDRIDGIDGSPALSTAVALLGFKHPYQAECPKKLGTIALKIVEHCISNFIHSGCPAVILRSDGEEPVDLNKIYADTFQGKMEEDSFTVLGQAFHAVHLRSYTSEETQHRIHYCAHKREVLSESLTKYVPNLRNRLKDSQDELFVWSTFIFGSYLDDHVSPEREEFTIPREDVPLQPNEITIQRIREAALPLVRKRLETYLAPIQEQKLARIRSFVSEKAPQYRPVLKHRPEAIDAIPPDLPDDKLDLELHKVYYHIEADIRTTGHHFLKEESVSKEQVAAYEKFLEEANDIGKSNLARYVTDRKLMLDLFSKSLSRTDAGSYELEESIHKIIFPLRSTSEDVHYSQQNLWIVDEKLTHHSYLASDKQLKTIDPVATDSKKRPDLIIFNRPFAFTDDSPPFSSVVLIEFKRAGRDDYEADDNPISQVSEYVRQVRQGIAKDRHGRPFQVPENVPFYGYILCDLTPKMARFCEDASFTKAPDAMGFFGYNPNLRTYFEVVSYTKLLEDAKKRNRVLFEKLNLPLL